MKQQKPLLTSLALGLLVIGCGSEPAPPPSAPPPPKAPAPAVGAASQDAPPPVPGGVPGATAQPEKPVENAPGPVVPSEGVTPEIVNTSITGLQAGVDQYMNDQGKKPKTVEEVKAAGYLDHIPKAPPGKRYIIDQKDFRVKEVSQ
jgi:hypothetical protein